MITGKNKQGAKIRLNTRSESGRAFVTITVIYANGMGFADLAGSVEEAKERMERSLGTITWGPET